LRFAAAATQTSPAAAMRHDRRCAMASEYALSPEKFMRLKRRYEANEETLAAIAADEDVTPQSLMALRREHDWRPRSARRTNKVREGKAAAKSARKSRGPGSGRTKKPKATQEAPPAARASPPPPGVVDMPTLIARIRAQLEGALAAAQERGPDADPDETARLMASLTRTLQSLRALEKDTTQDERAGDGKEALPLDLAELRRELARRIDLLREDREGA